MRSRDVSIQLAVSVCVHFLPKVAVFKHSRVREACGSQVDTWGVFDYSRLDHQGHRDLKWNTQRRIDEYMCRLQNDRTPMPYLLVGGIGSNDVTCVLEPVVRV